MVDAEAAYRKAKLDLGSLMNLKLEEIARLELKGTITDVAPPPPPVEELRKLALAERPDIVSVRLGIQRAEADFGSPRQTPIAMSIFYGSHTPFKTTRPMA